MSYLDEAAQDMAESFKRIFITAFGHGYDFGCESKEGECKRLEADNAKLRELAARAWRLFTENGAVHPSDLSEVDAVRDGLRELGVEVDG